MSPETTNPETRRTEQKIDPYAEKAMSWSGWGSPVGLGLFVLLICASIYLLHLAGLIR
jgi:hypothetical protein